MYKNRQYAYYIPQRDIAEGAGASGLPRLQAANVNEQVWSFLRRCLADPGWLIDYLPKSLTDNPAFDSSLVVNWLINLEGVSDQLFPVYQKHIFLLLVERVTVHVDRLDIQFSLDGLTELA